MHAILIWLVENAVVVACFAPIVWLACWLLRRRPAEQHLLWSLLLVKLLLPPFVPGFWSLGDIAWALRPATVEQPTAFEVAGAAPEQARDLSIAEAGPGSAEWTLVLTSEEPIAAAPAGIAPPTFMQTAAPVAFALWLIGCGLAVAIAARMLLSIGRLVHGSHPATPELQTALSVAARGLRMRPVPARLADGLPSPLVVCLARPLLLWPTAQAGAAALGRSAAVLVHELAHVKRRDHWIARLELLAGLIWWWNPVFWLIRRQLRETRELACDALALPTDAAARRDYAHLLLEMTTGQSISPHPAPVFGAGPVSRAALHRRLSMLFNERVTARVSALGLIVAALFGLMLLPGWTLAVDPPTLAQAPTDSPAALGTTPSANLETPPTPSTDATPAVPADGLINLTVQVAPASADGNGAPSAVGSGTGAPTPPPPGTEPSDSIPATPQPNSVLVVEQNSYPGHLAAAPAETPARELPLDGGDSILRVVSVVDGYVHLQLLHQGKLVQEFKVRVPQADSAAALGPPAVHGYVARLVEAAPGNRYGAVEPRQILTVAPRATAAHPLTVYAAPPAGTAEPIRVRVLAQPGAAGFDHLAIVAEPPTAAAADPQLQFECELAEVTLEEKRVELEIASEEAREKFGDNPDAATRGRIKLLQLAVRKSEIELARCKARLNQPAAAPGYPIVPPTPSAPPSVAPPSVPAAPAPGAQGAK